MADSEGDELVVGYTLGTGPHAGFMFIPVVARFEDLRLDGMFDYGEGLDGLLRRRMGGVEADLFLGSWP